MVLGKSAPTVHLEKGSLVKLVPPDKDFKLVLNTLTAIIVSLTSSNKMQIKFSETSLKLSRASTTHSKSVSLIYLLPTQ